jgi:hypothetical protein
MNLLFRAADGAHSIRVDEDELESGGIRGVVSNNAIRLEAGYRPPNLK